VGTIISIYLASIMVFYLFSLIFTASKPNESSASNNLFADFFTLLVFPVYFVKAAIAHGKKRMKIWE
jgi:hypothetical protein